MFKECRHILPSGRKCKAAALRDKCFCYHHWRLRTAGQTHGRPNESLPLPSLEDPQGIQIALTQVLGVLGSSRLDSKSAGQYLYALQIATQLATRASVPDPGEVVRSLSSDPAGGEDLAPETVQCEPGAECDSCATRDQCVLPARIAYLDARQTTTEALRNLRDREQHERDMEEAKKNPPLSQAQLWALEPEWDGPLDGAPDLDSDDWDDETG